MDNAEWWEVFRRASELRDHFRQINNGLEMEAKREAMRTVRQEAFALLYETHIPQPLKMLVGDLMGGKLVDMWPDGKVTLALIEAEQSGPVGNKRLATLLKEKGGLVVDPTQIRRWRADLEYQSLVKRCTPMEGDTNSG